MRALAIAIAVVLMGAMPAMAAEPSASQVREMRMAMGVALIDETKARYDELRVVQVGSRLVMCGYVDAGGRAGWERFAWVVGAEVPVLADTPMVAGSAEAVAGVCGE